MYMYIHTYKFVSLLIPCFLLQKERVEQRIEFRESFQRIQSGIDDCKEFYAKMVRDEVSYMFGDDTIKFTLTYRLACSSTGGKNLIICMYRSADKSLAQPD